MTGCPRRPQVGIRTLLWAFSLGLAGIPAFAAPAQADALPGSATTTTQAAQLLTLSAPVTGPVTSPYGMRLHPTLHVWKLHGGVDFAATCGAPVHASAAGTVQWAAYQGGYGNQVGIDHGHGVSTSYGHLTSASTTVGAQVAGGQVIGYAGATGYAAGCHVHLMVYVGGKAVNPVPYLSKRAPAATPAPVPPEQAAAAPALQTQEASATAPAPAPSTKATTYTVKAGDTLTAIAARAWVSSYRLVYEANRDQIKDPNLIYVGQALVLPPTGDRDENNAGPPRNG